MAPPPQRAPAAEGVVGALPHAQGSTARRRSGSLPDRRGVLRSPPLGRTGAGPALSSRVVVRCFRGPSHDIQPRLHDRAVDEHEAQQKTCQCRNWPEHGACIGSSPVEVDPHNEDVSAEKCSDREESTMSEDERERKRKERRTTSPTSRPTATRRKIRTTTTPRRSASGRSTRTPRTTSSDGSASSTRPAVA